MVSVSGEWELELELGVVYCFLEVFLEAFFVVFLEVFLEAFFVLDGGVYDSGEKVENRLVFRSLLFCFNRPFIAFNAVGGIPSFLACSSIALSVIFFALDGVFDLLDAGLGEGEEEEGEEESEGDPCNSSNDVAPVAPRIVSTSSWSCSNISYSSSVKTSIVDCAQKGHS